VNLDSVDWPSLLLAHVPIGWPSYAWWRDIGTALISAAAAVVIGASTLTIAVRAQAFARMAKSDQDRQQYEERLVTAVEKSVDEVLQYVKGSTEGWTVGRNDHRLAQASVTGRLVLLNAVSRGEDRAVVDLVTATFGIISDYKALDVQVNSIGELIGVLAALAARSHSSSELLDTIATIRRTAKITDYEASK
jgi:hypothetical protein